MNTLYVTHDVFDEALLALSASCKTRVPYEAQEVTFLFADASAATYFTQSETIVLYCGKTQRAYAAITLKK